MSTQCINPADYQNLLQKLLQQSGATDIFLDQENFSVSFEMGSKARIKLAPWYAAHKHLADTEMRRAIRKLLAEFQRKLELAHPHLQQIKLQLMPVVRDKRYFSLAQLQMLESDAGRQIRFPLRKLAGEMVMALFLEQEQTTRLVTQDLLDEWQISFDQAWQFALKNLRARTTGQFQELAPGLFCSIWQDGYDSSRSLLPELYQSLRLLGDPVFAFPTRSHLLIAGSHDLTGLQAMTKHCLGLLQQTEQALSTDWLTCSEQGWQSFDADPAARTALREEQIKILAKDYAQQKVLLNRVLPQQGKDWFVVCYQTQRTDEGAGWVSMAQLTDKGANLLPEADKFACLDTQNSELLLVDWSQAQQIFGAAMQKQALYPKRYLVQGQASAEQLALLRQVAQIQPVHQ